MVTDDTPQNNSFNIPGYVPSQSSKTITQSFTEDGNNMLNISSKTGKKRLKRGATTKYLLDSTPEYIVDNTLSGLLIKFLRENGAQTFKILLKLVISQYDTIRKLSGHLYTSDVKRSLNGALTSNGLFEQVHTSEAEGEDRLNSSMKSISNQSLNHKDDTSWKVIDKNAQVYLDEKLKQVKDQREKLFAKHKYKIKEANNSEFQDYSSIENSSRNKLDLQINRDIKVQQKKLTYMKLNTYVNEMSSEEEEKHLSSKSNTMSMLTYKLAKATQEQEVLNNENLPEQVQGAMQVYSYFRDILTTNSFKNLNLGLNALTQSINSLNANI